MTSSTITSQTPLFREALAHESARAARIFQPLALRPGDGPVCTFVAVRERPIVRLLAAACWCETSADTASFLWKAIYSIRESKIEQDLLIALVRHIRDKSPQLKHVHHAGWISPNSPSAKILNAAGWEITSTRHYFMAEPSAWRPLLEDKELPSEFRIIPLVPSQAREITSFLKEEAIECEAADIALGFKTAWGQAPTLFDPRCSFLVQSGDATVGICLANLRGPRLELEIFSAPPEMVKPMLRYCLQSAEAITSISAITRHQDAASSVAGPLLDLSTTPAGKYFRFSSPLSAANPTDEA
jgi:hypothetical protein